MKKLLPPTWFLMALVLMGILHFVVPVTQIINGPWRLSGLAPLSLGVLLNYVAGKAFVDHDTTIKPFGNSSALVTTGVFRVSRNPMYLGLTLILGGVAILMGSLSPWILVVLYPVLMDRLFIVAEEERLEKKFGGEFNEYRSRVRRWI